MQVYLSTLTEMDYIETLEKLEQHYTNNEGLDGKSHSKIISNLRKQPTYNYELEVIAKKEDGYRKSFSASCRRACESSSLYCYYCRWLS